MQPSLLCKGLRGAQWHLGSYDCQNLHHNTHKRGGPKWPPIRPQGLKMRSRTTGIFYKKKLLPFILQKNSFCSSIVLEHSGAWLDRHQNVPEQLSCDSVIFVFLHVGIDRLQSEIELWQRNFRLFTCRAWPAPVIFVFLHVRISWYRSAGRSQMPKRS